MSLVAGFQESFNKLYIRTMGITETFPGVPNLAHSNTK